MKYSTACSKSWTDVNINFSKRQLGHCCVSKYHDMPEVITTDYYSNNKLIQQRRQDTLNGIQHPDCQSCWNEINNNITSFKDIMGEWKDFTNVKSDQPQVNYIEMEIDNVCDLSCLYCHPKHSSKIAKEEGVDVPNKVTSHDVEVYKEWLKSTVLDSKEPINIAFLGGEPTASKLFYEMIDFIVSLNASNLTVNITTNCNSKEHLFNKLKNAMDKSNFSWVINVSNESFKEHSQLIRYGLDWDRFENNVRAYASHPRVKNLVFDCAINSLAIPTFPKYIKWIYELMLDYEKKFTILGSSVSNPKQLDVKNLPSSYRKYIREAEKIVKNSQKSNCIRTDKILKFLNSVKERIGSDYKDNYKDIIRNFLEQKQTYKQTNTLLRLIDEDSMF